MPKAYLGGTNRAKLYLGKTKGRRCYLGSTKIYSAGNTVTYHVGTEIYSEEVDEETSCLSPTTFTPTHDGWEFLGWRENSDASGDVLSSKLMADDPIDLYAVFKQKVTLTTYNGSTSPTTSSKERYYNTENITNPSFTIWQNSISGWSANGWATSNTANANIELDNGSTVSLSSNATYYGRYSQTIYLYYNGNGAGWGSTSTQSGTRYYNSGNYSNPSFQVSSNGFGKSNYSFANWSLNWGTRYNPGSWITLDTSATMYAMWVQSSFSSPSLSKYNVRFTTNPWTGSSYTPKCECRIEGNKMIVWEQYCSGYNVYFEARTAEMDLSPFSTATISYTADVFNTNNIRSVQFGFVGGSSVTVSSGSSTSINISSLSSAQMYIIMNAGANRNHYANEVDNILTINSITFS